MIEFVILFLSSLVSFIINFYHLSPGVVQQAILVLLLILLIFSRNIALFNSKTKKFPWPRFLLLFLTSSFVQLLIISTGGFYSPFFPVFYFFTLGISFILDFKKGIGFLVLSLGALATSTFLDMGMLANLKNDPGVAILYSISFVGIIPLSYLLSHSYQLKDSLLGILNEYIKVEHSKEESILRGLDEIVVLTDSRLKILSVNLAFEQAVHVANAEASGKNLLEVLPLKNKDGSLVTVSALSIDKVMADKSTRIMEGFYLSAASGSGLLKVSVQVRPIVDSMGFVNQIIFIITEPKNTTQGQVLHANLEQAKLKFKHLITSLENSFQTSNRESARKELIMLEKIEEDLLLSMELEDHSLKQTIDTLDAALLCKQAIEERRAFAQIFAVEVKLVLPEGESEELALFSLSGSNLPTKSIPISKFAVLTDKNWFLRLIQRLIDLSIMICPARNDTKVEVILQKEQEAKITVSLAVSPIKISNSAMGEIFKEYYGQLASITNLNFGSGLEGFIIKEITRQAAIPLTTRLSTSTDTLIISLTLPQNLR